LKSVKTGCTFQTPSRMTERRRWRSSDVTHDPRQTEKGSRSSTLQKTRKRETTQKTNW